MKTIKMTGMTKEDKVKYKVLYDLMMMRVKEEVKKKHIERVDKEIKENEA